MQTPIMQRLKSIADTAISYALYLLFKPIHQRFRSAALSTAGLVITATAGKKLPKIGAAVFHYVADGTSGQIAAGVDMPALSGTVTNAYWNVFVFTVNKAGTTYSHTGTQATTEAAVKWPTIPTDRAIIGFLKIHPTGTGDFVGNTHALDDGTIAPNAQYVSPTGAIYPGARVD